MGTSLNGLTPKDTYPALLKTSDNTALSATSKFISDGVGNDSALSLATSLIGIGTTTGTARLTVKGTGTTQATTSLLVQNSSGTSSLTILDDRSSYFNGLVGINNATPATQLDVNGSIFFSSNQLIGSGNIFAVKNQIVLYNSSTGAIDITMNNPSWYIRHNANMSMAGSLNVGSNTTGTAQLQVKGSGSTSATTSLLVQNSAGTELFKVQDDATFSFGNGSLTLVNVVSAAGALRLDSGGVSGVIRLQGNQIGMGDNTTGDASALLTLTSTTKGFLPPRMTSVQKNAIGTPAAGLIVYDTTLNKLCVRTVATWETISSV